MPPLTRRDFLSLFSRLLLSLSGLLGVGMLARYLSYRPPTMPSKRFAAGPAADYPPGSRRVLADIPALLVHDDQGFAAISMVCTHLGCAVEQGEEGFACPCHGSRFDLEGQVTRGPASRPLPRLKVEVTAEGVVVEGE